MICWYIQLFCNNLNYYLFDSEISSSKISYMLKGVFRRHFNWPCRYVMQATYWLGQVSLFLELTWMNTLWDMIVVRGMPYCLKLTCLNHRIIMPIWFCSLIHIYSQPCLNKQNLLEWLIWRLKRKSSTPESNFSMSWNAFFFFFWLPKMAFFLFCLS